METIIQPEWEVNNIVVSAVISDQKIDLPQIAKKLESEYNPGRFPGLVMRSKEPKASFLIFSTGKVVVTGLRNEGDIEKAIMGCMVKLSKIGIPIGKLSFTIQNMVASGDIHMRIDLNEASIIMDNVVFEPEVFPGLIYRMQDPRAVFLLFSTGKFVCTGVKTKDTIAIAVEKVFELLTTLGVARPAINGEKDD